jgi:hypothetical protein
VPAQIVYGAGTHFVDWHSQLAANGSCGSGSCGSGSGSCGSCGSGSGCNRTHAVNGSLIIGGNGGGMPVHLAILAPPGHCQCHAATATPATATPATATPATATLPLPRSHCHPLAFPAVHINSPTSGISAHALKFAHDASETYRIWTDFEAEVAVFVTNGTAEWINASVAVAAAVGSGIDTGTGTGSGSGSDTGSGSGVWEISRMFETT